MRYLVKPLAMFAVLLALTVAGRVRADYPTTPSYSGGTTSITVSGQGTTTGSYINNTSGDASGLDYVGNVSHGGGSSNSSCSGQIKALFTWGGSTPIPENVVVIKEGNVSWDWEKASPRATGTPTGSGSAVNFNGPATQDGVETTAFNYTQQAGGTTVEVDDSTLSANASAASPPAVIESSHVAYAVRLSPVTISLVGLTANSDGSYTISVGQLAAAQLNGIPTGCSVTSYSWQVSGTYNQGYFPQTGSASTPATGIASGGTSEPYWYWYGDSQNATVTCTAQVTPPANAGSSFSVSATLTVHVVAPAFMASYITGMMHLDQQNPDDSNYALYPGKNASKTNSLGGITWSITVTPVTGTPSNSMSAIEQVITSNNNSYTINKVPVYPSNWHKTGLDTVMPYDFYPVDGNAHLDDDSPYVGLQDSDDSATIDLGFKDWAVFLPPFTYITIGSNQVPTGCYVPLGNGTWTVNSTASEPQTPSPSWSYWVSGTTPNGAIVTTAFNANTSTYATWTASINGNSTN